MEKITSFVIIPTIIICKINNQLTFEAKETFNLKWDKYYSITFTWLFWDYSFFSKNHKNL